MLCLFLRPFFYFLSPFVYLVCFDKYIWGWKHFIIYLPYLIHVFIDLSNLWACGKTHLIASSFYQ